MVENVSMVTLDLLRTEKKAAIFRIGELHGASNIRVFGSVARGDNREESDIDFLVDFEKGRSLFDLIRFKLDLQELLHATVDVVTPGKPAVSATARAGRSSASVTLCNRRNRKFISFISATAAWNCANAPGSAMPAAPLLQSC